jgi:hypothetical protein
MGHSVCGDYTWCSARHRQDLITPPMLTNRWFVVLTEQDTTASASRPLRTSTRSCPALGAPVPCPLAIADGIFV